MDNAVSFILALGQHTQLVKIDLKDVHSILPIHPEDRHLLGISWENHVYVDLCLQIDLKDVHSILPIHPEDRHLLGISWENHVYVDLCLLISVLGSLLCSWRDFTGEAHLALRTAMDVFADLHVPVSLPKPEGPSTTVSFFGILIDTVQMELRLPHDKLLHLKSLVVNLLGRRFGWRSVVKSLLGHLLHPAVVVKPGRIFLRHLFFLMTNVAMKHHFVYLDAMAWADLAWWDCFL